MYHFAFNLVLVQRQQLPLIGTAAALGDAGSPASDSTLGPTSGLNMDGQHDHMKDSVVSDFYSLQYSVNDFWLDCSNGTLNC